MKALLVAGLLLWPMTAGAEPADLPNPAPAIALSAPPTQAAVELASPPTALSALERLPGPQRYFGASLTEPTGKLFSFGLEIGLSGGRYPASCTAPGCQVFSGFIETSVSPPVLLGARVSLRLAKQWRLVAWADLQPKVAVIMADPIESLGSMVTGGVETELAVQGSRTLDFLLTVGLGASGIAASSGTEQVVEQMQAACRAAADGCTVTLGSPEPILRAAVGLAWTRLSFPLAIYLRLEAADGYMFANYEQPRMPWEPRPDSSFRMNDWTRVSLSAVMGVF